MQKAQKRNAARDQKFWFRRDITTHVSPPAAAECCRTGTSNCDVKECDMFGQMTVNDIINGKVSSFDIATITSSLLFNNTRNL